MLIAQLSDMHVCRPGLLYKGVADSNAMFRQAIDHLHGLDRQPDLVLLTGDLVDQGLAEEYATILGMLGKLRYPYLVIPGNHDEREPFRAAFGGHGYLPSTGPLHYCVDRYPVRIIGLDSCQPGQHHGHIDPEGLEWMAETLAANPRQPTVVMLHHPPFVSGIGYLDHYRYREPDRLMSLLGACSNIEAVLCGHVHRPMVRRLGGTVVMTCPSTTTQIALQLDPEARPQSYVGPPACLLHRWEAGQGLVSHTSYIGTYPGPYPFF